MATAEDVFNTANKILPMTARRFRDAFGIDPDSVALVYSRFVDLEATFPDVSQATPICPGAIYVVFVSSDFDRRFDHPELKREAVTPSLTALSVTSTVPRLLPSVFTIYQGSITSIALSMRWLSTSLQGT
eukprot:1392897-Amorphochlora_amoeboformis.AAC.2